MNKKQSLENGTELFQVSEIELIYSPTKIDYGIEAITKSSDAEKVFRSIWSNQIEIIEEFFVLYLNRSNLVKGYYKVSKGGITGTFVDMRVIFAIALKSLSTTIVLAHNHPSGSLKASDADIDLTKRIIQGGKLLDVKILDHIILCPNDGYYSMSDNGEI